MGQNRPQNLWKPRPDELEKLVADLESGSLPLQIRSRRTSVALNC